MHGERDFLFSHILENTYAVNLHIQAFLGIINDFVDHLGIKSINNHLGKDVVRIHRFGDIGRDKGDRTHGF